jgi:hypothetical protein
MHAILGRFTGSRRQAALVQNWTLDTGNGAVPVGAVVLAWVPEGGHATIGVTVGNAGGGLLSWEPADVPEWRPYATKIPPAGGGGRGRGRPPAPPGGGFSLLLLAGLAALLALLVLLLLVAAARRRDKRKHAQLAAERDGRVDPVSAPLRGAPAGRE